MGIFSDYRGLWRDQGNNASVETNHWFWQLQKFNQAVCDGIAPADRYYTEGCNACQAYNWNPSDRWNSPRSWIALIYFSHVSLQCRKWCWRRYTANEGPKPQISEIHTQLNGGQPNIFTTGSPLNINSFHNVFWVLKGHFFVISRTEELRMPTATAALQQTKQRRNSDRGCGTGNRNKDLWSKPVSCLIVQ